MLEGEVIRVVGKAAVRGAGHWIMRTLSVIAVIGMGWLIYVGMIKPHFDPIQTTTQQADEITNTYITESDDAFFFGIKFWGIKLGISKPVKVKKPVITQEKNDR